MNGSKNTFFTQKTTSSTSKKVAEKGPSAKQQRDAIINDQYWIILNQFHLASLKKDSKLNNTANAIKHALQTFGPSLIGSEIELLHGKGAAKKHIFHAHAFDEHATYELEWTKIDASYYYTPCAKNDKAKIESRSIYLMVENDQLHYEVINPAGKIVANHIAKNVLNSIGVKLPKALNTEKLIEQFISPHWSKLLDIMSSRGDTCINRMIALLNFDTHENFPFTEQPLTKLEQNTILANPVNNAIINKASIAIHQIKEKDYKKTRLAPSYRTTT